MIVHQNQNVMEKLHVPENKNVKMARGHAKKTMMTKVVTLVGASFGIVVVTIQIARSRNVWDE